MNTTAVGPTPARAGIATFEAIVLDSIADTADSRTLVLDPGVPLSYRAGQYVQIPPHQFRGLASVVAYLEHLKGRREAPRAYSMSSAPHERHVAITIKEEVYDKAYMKYPPLLSGFLVHQVRAGDFMTVRGFAGGYTLPEDVEARTDHILHVCAGSGVVPNFSMLKDALHRHPGVKHTFIYSNKTWADVIFRDALGVLSREHSGQLRVIHTLTREAGLTPPDVRRGRIGAELLQRTLGEFPNSLVYVCGPAVTVWERRACATQGVTPTPRFLEAMLSHLELLQVPRARIKFESYG